MEKQRMDTPTAIGIIIEFAEINVVGAAVGIAEG